MNKRLFLLVNTPPSHPSFDMYNNSQFADSGFLSRTPTPPTPGRVPSPQPIPLHEELDYQGIYSNNYHCFLFSPLFLNRK
jgi:hypothetical protein